MTDDHDAALICVLNSILNNIHAFYSSNTCGLRCNLQIIEDAALTHCSASCKQICVMAVRHSVLMASMKHLLIARDMLLMVIHYLNFLKMQTCFYVERTANVRNVNKWTPGAAVKMDRRRSVLS